MKENFARREVVAPERLRELSRRSNAKGALQTLSHFGAIALTGAGLYVGWGTPWAVPLFVLHGMLLNYLFAAQHEFNHYTVFRTRWLNDVFNHVTGLLVLYPRSHERWFHYEHHRNTHQWERDPELANGPYSLGSYVLNLLGISYWYRRARTMLVQASGHVPDAWLTAPQRLRVVREARVHIAIHVVVITVSALTGSWLAVQLWYAPLLATKVLHQVQNITEHTALPHEQDTLANTRTIRTNAFMRWMAWNMQYHSAHHTYPAVPFHALPALHAEIVAARGEPPPTIGYIEFQLKMLRALLRGPEPRAGLT